MAESLSTLATVSITGAISAPRKNNPTRRGMQRKRVE